MIGRTIRHYKILEKLGEGGMGVVYKAEDTKLKRLVALKFLQPFTFGSEEQQKLFVQEARAAAALDHPNICTIYEINEENEQFFIAMAYIEGENLKEKIKSGPMDLKDALHIAVQIGRGLEAAHKKGVVHRDIKSANIMVTGESQVKIMDFGLAKRTDGEEDSESTITVGTAGYMSPEQARGDSTDHRTDIWSWGVCMYEMLTGMVPFRGAYDAAVLYSVLNEAPAPISDWRSDVPVELVRIVEKAMAKNLNERYQSMTDLLAQLENREKSLDVTIEEVSHVEPFQPSIAVLPFTDMSPGRDQEYFCDGVAEEIINALTKVESLHVVARTSAFSFKGRTEDVREIGKTLNVGTLLEGSVRKAGNQLRIATQLINVTNGYHIWSDQFDRELKDVFAIQEEIAQNIVQALEVKLSEREKQALEKPATKDIQAYDFYLRGRKFFYQSKREGINYAREMFSRAIEKDPNYALAYAGMADCYSYLYMYFDSSEANLEQAMITSQKALELDPDLAEAHAARGLALSLDKKYDEAAKEFETSMRLKPKLFEAHYFYARTCFSQGKLKKAAQLYEQACFVSPEEYQAPSLLGFTYRSLNLRKKAEAAYRRSLDNISKHLEMNPDDSRALYLGACAFVELGNPEKGLEWANRALSIDPDDPYNLYGISCLYSRLGKVDEAIHYFEKSLKTGFAHKEWIENDSDFDPIRSDPRFQNLLKKLG